MAKTLFRKDTPADDTEARPAPIPKTDTWRAQPVSPMAEKAQPDRGDVPPTKEPDLFTVLLAGQAAVSNALETEFRVALREAAALAAKKGADYDREGPITAKMPFGNSSFAREVFKKAFRLVGLIKSGTKSRNESIDDSILDIIVYCAYWLAARKLGW